MVIIICCKIDSYYMNLLESTIEEVLGVFDKSIFLRFLGMQWRLYHVNLTQYP